MLRCWWTYFSVKRPLRLALCSKWHPWRHIPPCSHFASWLWLYLAELVPKIIFVIICRLGWWRHENTSHTLGPDVPQHWRLLHSNLCQTELGSDILTIFSSISMLYFCGYSGMWNSPSAHARHNSSSLSIFIFIFSTYDTRQNNLITRLCFICYTVHTSAIR